MIEQRDALLSGLANIANLVSDRPMGKAEMVDEAELLPRTLPIQAHLNALEPDILLITGGRGAGKSHLFRLINLPQGPQILGYRGRAANAWWLPGFTTHRTTSGFNFPGETILQRFAAGKSRTDLMDFWRGLLMVSIISQDTPAAELLHQQLPTALLRALSSPEKVSDWHAEVVRHLESVETALNQLDSWLVAQQHYLFATYDDLDVMAVEWTKSAA